MIMIRRLFFRATRLIQRFGQDDFIFPPLLRTLRFSSSSSTPEGDNWYGKPNLPAEEYLYVEREAEEKRDRGKWRKQTRLKSNALRSSIARAADARTRLPVLLRRTHERTLEKNVDLPVEKPNVLHERLRATEQLNQAQAIIESDDLSPASEQLFRLRSESTGGAESRKSSSPLSPVVREAEKERRQQTRLKSNALRSSTFSAGDRRTRLPVLLRGTRDATSDEKSNLPERLETTEELNLRPTGENDDLSPAPSPETREPSSPLPPAPPGSVQSKRTWYGAECQRRSACGDIRGALDLFYRQIDEGIIPDEIGFTIIFDAVGPLGDLVEADRLLELMDKLGVPLNAFVASALFTCYANSAAGEALARTVELRERLARDGVKLNVRAYYTMIKAYTRCTANAESSVDMRALYSIHDEMERNAVELDTKCHQQLLYATSFDRSNGFLEAILVARRIAKKGERLNSHMFGNLLIVCRKCGIRDLIEAAEVLGVASCNPTALPTSRLDLWKGVVRPSLDDYILSPAFRAPHDFPPLALLAETPVGRFALLGGVDGILQQLRLHGEQPDIELFGQFAHSDFMPDVPEADTFLDSRVVAGADGPFIVRTVARRVQRSGRRSAVIPEFLDELSKRKVKLDLKTAYAIAEHCKFSSQMRQLLAEMAKADIAPDIELFHRLMHCALFKSWNLRHVEEILGEIDARGLKPSEELIRLAEQGVSLIQHMIDAGKDNDGTFPAKLARFKKVLGEFKTAHGLMGRKFFTGALRKR